MNKEAGRKIIAERVEEFEKNKAILTKKGHGETNIRSNYIDIMFKALGWNMKSHYEVVREFSQRDKSTDGGTKKVDYAFKINGKLKFFIEAKEASVDLEKDKSAIFQAKRYAYSSNGKAPIVILTDFEEFRVFNVIKAPLMDNTDRELLKSHTMRYTDYLEKWDLLWDTFSREAVEKGSLDKLRGKIDKNTKTMDVDFLEQITSWRELLAKNIAIRNENLNVDEINEAVQRILDRLVFIRNLEDREIEPENTLLDKTKKSENIYKSLIPIFNSLNTTYNGLLFKKHFSEEIDVDDKTIHDIIRQMNYPVSPFQFDVIEPEILGRIYEKFLGSKIRLTDSHRAKIEEKIEVRKAGGVYYTPEYIVEYIVQNTVGKKIEGLAPEEIKNIKIVDPACGSGSFLIGAYSYLLDYHQKWYTENHKDKTYQADWYKTKDGEIKVRLEKRGDILRNNIFGVDIDKEATEVAIMSLYLKMLDEGFDKGEKDLFFVKGSVLPDMIENIKCGNSLIGTDFFDGSLEFDNTEFKQIKPFNWQDEFKKIYKNNGFDCVIGNPPYILIQDIHRDDKVLDYFKNKYYSSSYKIDTYHIFIEQGIKLLNEAGLMGYITPSNYLTNNGLFKMREYILQNSRISILNIITGSVFIDASVDTCISIFSKNESIESNMIFSIWNGNSLEAKESKNFDQKFFLNNEKYLFTSTETISINVPYFNLGEKYNVNFGMQLRDRKKYTSDVIDTSQKDFITKYHQKCYTGKDVSRYHMGYSNLLAYVNRIAKCGGCWDEKAHLTNPKIIVRQIGEYPICSLDENGFYSLNTVFLITPKDGTELSVKFLIGILNSNFIKYYWNKVFYDMRKTFPKIKGTYLEKLPIPNINQNDEKYSDMIKLVDNIIKLHKDILTAKSESDKNILEKQISFIDKKIDDLVYKLYNLSNKEIELIDEN
ncbi:MAG: TaqI-like C-terminal specificity domain-containing protein [Spirochaetota bacterium]